MKKILFWSLILMVVIPAVAFSFAKKPAVSQNAGTVSGKKYGCSMGCYFSDKPGKCPKCGMDLMEVVQ